MIVRLALATAATFFLTALVAAPAHAGIGQSGDADGFSVSVTAVVTGDAGAVPTGSISLAVPPKCWWEPMSADYDLSGTFDAGDPKAFKKFYDEMIVQMRGHAAAGYYSFPSEEYVRSIVVAENKGEADYTWYVLECQDGVNAVEEGYAESRGTYGDAYGIGAGEDANVPIAVSFRAFQQGEVPPPLIDVADLAQVLWDHAAAAIEDPTLDRNPKITEHGGSTLVNLPTWFWVTNPAAALANDGSLHLEASIPGTPVRMALDASTDGVTVTSPVGVKECTVDQVRTAYSSGASEAEACTVAFSRAGTWPVTATTTWTGSWEGVDNDGPQSGAVDVIGRSSTVNVRVDESQALVRSVS